MSEYDRLTASLAATAGDYQFEHDNDRMDAQRVGRWVQQFPEGSRLELLRELDHVLENCYVSEQDAVDFLSGVAKDQKFTGRRQRDYWSRVNFLDLQHQGSSQGDLLELFAGVLDDEFGLDLAHCGSPDGDAIYLDDAIHSGLTAGNDLEEWIREEASNGTRLRIVVLATHAYGSFRMSQRLERAALESDNDVAVQVWRAVTFENRRYFSRDSEVYWPAELPDDDAVREYVAAEERFPFEPRPLGGTSWPFSSESGRALLEGELLLAGLRIRGFSENSASIIRPLGWGPFGLGSGSTLVTYRNCPNNAPLALWWGDPRAYGGHPFRKWFPLFPRRTHD